MQPRVTIGIPVYNGGRFLAESIESVLAQTFGDFEIVISDNGSSDDTATIAWRYAAADPRVRYTRVDSNRGAAWNYNHLNELARGAYFKWQAHDDVIAPGYLERAVRVLDRQPDVVLAYGRTRLIDEQGEEIEDIDDRMHLPYASAHERLGRMLANACMCNPITGVMRTGALRRTRGIGRFRGSDYVLLAELAMLGLIHEIPERLFYRRIHSDSFQRANADNREIHRWLDPTLSGGPYFPSVRLNIELIRSVLRMNLRHSEKLACLWAVHHWPRARLRDRLGRFRASLRAWFPKPSTP